MASALSASLVASKTTLLPRPSLRGYFIACGWTRSGLQQSAQAHGDLLCALEHMTGHSQVVGQMRLSGASASAQMDFCSEAIFDSLMHVADRLHWKLAARLPTTYACFVPRSAYAADEAALSCFIGFIVYFIQCHAMSCIAVLQR